mgnify:FL=1
MITTVVADGKNEYEFIDLLKKRAQNSDKNVVPIVSEIIENVAQNGDKAVKEYTVKFDGKAPEKVEITSDEKSRTHFFCRNISVLRQSVEMPETVV